jgi:hypothetical protein
MHMNRWMSVVTGIFTLCTALPSLAAYQYTYTSRPFEYVENSFTSGPGAGIDTSDFLKIVITTNSLFGDDFSTNEGILDNATIDFTVGDFSNRALPVTNEAPLYVYARNFVSAVDNNRLPTSWGFEYGEELNRFTDPNFQSVAYYSVEELTQFSATLISPGSNERVFGAGFYGKWTLNEVSSPVPELPASAMLLAGLSVIGIASRHKKQPSIRG